MIGSGFLHNLLVYPNIYDLFLRLKIKDFIHNIINDNPDINIINLDELAHKLTKIFPWINPLIKSNPPKNIIKPIKTTMCMNNFFLLGNFFAKKDKIIIVRPNIVGIKEVIDWL